MAILAQFQAHYDGSDRAQLIASYADVVAIQVLSEIDGSNVDTATVDITNASSTTPLVWVESRAEIGDWRMFFFAVNNADGKTPTFRISRTRESATAANDANWKPCYTTDTTDISSWVYASTLNVQASYIEFSFADPLPSGTVYVSTSPMGRQSDCEAFAADMLVTYSTVCAPAPSSNASGVFHTSPSETDEDGWQIGGNPMYGLHLDFGGSTNDGGPKRVLVLMSHIHAQGEAYSWIPFRAHVDWIINSSSAEAVAFRQNWEVLLYFAVTPNGLKGGHYRWNLRSNTDPNRDWASTTLDEISALKTAIAADVASIGRFDALYSWHGWSFYNTPALAYVTPEDNSAGTRAAAIQAALDAAAVRFGQSVVIATSGTYNTDIWWAREQGATVYLDTEVPQRGDNSISALSAIGTTWGAVLADLDADGAFTTFSVVTGTGALSSQTSTLAGTGVREVTSSGAIESQSSALAGTGAVGGVVTGTAALTAQSSTIAGTGVREVNATGALASQAATIAGTAEREITSTGALASQSSSIDGTGTTTPAGVVTGTGALTSQDSSISGSGILERTGTGAIASGVATIDATGIITRTGTGALAAQVSQIAGVGTTYTPGTITGTAELAAGSSSISGVGRGAIWTKISETSTTWTSIIEASTTWTDL